MDFISTPELFLSLGGVIAVFIAITGLMIVLATQLTEQAGLFWLGIGGPVVLLIVAFFLRPWAPWILGIAAAILIGTPLVLAFQRPADCGKPIAAGLGMLIVGGAGVAATLMTHYAYFVK